jgi:hypothetical protein
VQGELVAGAPVQRERERERESGAPVAPPTANKLRGQTPGNKKVVCAREVEVTIQSARHLPKMDFMGSCDAFCEIEWQVQMHKY